MEDTIESPPVQYQCECIPLMRERLQKHHGTEVSFNLAQFMQEPADDAEEVTFIMGFQPFHYTWMEKRKVRRSHVQFRFCPMCGKKI